MIASHNTEKRHAAAAPARQQAKILPGLWYGIKSAALLDEDDDEESLLSGCDL